MQGNFFNASISYGSLDNKFVFQLICRIPAPHGSNYLIRLCSGLWILLPDQAAHLSERKRNFNQWDTYCEKKENRNGFLFLKSSEQTYNDEGNLCDSKCRVCCPIDSPLYFNAL